MVFSLRYVLTCSILSGGIRMLRDNADAGRAAKICQMDFPGREAAGMSSGMVVED